MGRNLASGPPSGAAARNIKSNLAHRKRGRGKLLLHTARSHAVGRFVGTPYFFVHPISRCRFMGVDQYACCLWLAVRRIPVSPPLSHARTRSSPSTSCVLIRQNISDQAFERRNHLELQINLLAERKSTLSLALLQRIAAHLNCPVEKDAQSEQLAEKTEVDEIAQELRAREEADKKAAG